MGGGENSNLEREESTEGEFFWVGGRENIWLVDGTPVTLPQSLNVWKKPKYNSISKKCLICLICILTLYITMKFFNQLIIPKKLKPR